VNVPRPPVVRERLGKAWYIPAMPRILVFNSHTASVPAWKTFARGWLLLVSLLGCSCAAQHASEQTGSSPSVYPPSPNLVDPHRAALDHPDQVPIRNLRLQALTLEDAQRLAQMAAPDVVLAAARANAARSEVDVAGMYSNPTVTVGTTLNNQVLFGNLYMALPLFGQLRKAMDAADAQARVLAAGVDVSRLDARLAVTLAWVDLWQLKGEFQIAKDNAARREKILETARVRFSEGSVPQLDVLRAKTNARQAGSEVAALKEQQVAAMARLAVLLKNDDLQEVEIQGDPGGQKSPPALASLGNMVQEHPLTKRARVMLHASDSVVAREQRNRVPLVGVQIGGSMYNRQPPPTHDVNLAISMTLPVFNAPLITRAERNRDAVRTELNTVIIQLRARLVSARADYLAALRRQEAQLRDVLPAAKEAADLSAEAYQSGGLDLTGTLAAEQALSDARLASVRATANLARALGALEHAAGRAL
jgi:outer membrane protein TolC